MFNNHLRFSPAMQVSIRPYTGAPQERLSSIFPGQMFACECGRHQRLQYSADKGDSLKCTTCLSNAAQISREYSPKPFAADDCPICNGFGGSDGAQHLAQAMGCGRCQDLQECRAVVQNSGFFAHVRNLEAAQEHEHLLSQIFEPVSEESTPMQQALTSVEVQEACKSSSQLSHHADPHS